MRRSTRALSPITSQKHIVQHSVASVAAGARSIETVASVVNIRTTSNTDVLEGSKVFTVYLERWIEGQAAGANFGLAVIKLASGNAGPNYANCTNLNDWGGKNNILYMTYGIVGTTNPVPVVREWIKIPKKRMALGDTIIVVIWSQSGGVDHCGHDIYKEYT